jgi:hypothetical protein
MRIMSPGVQSILLDAVRVIVRRAGACTTTSPTTAGVRNRPMTDPATLAADLNGISAQPFADGALPG